MAKEDMKTCKLEIADFTTRRNTRKIFEMVQKIKETLKEMFYSGQKADCF